MKIWKVRIYFISKEVFQYSLIAYLVLFITEAIKQGLVSFFFNLNILLFVVLFSGLVMVITHNERLDEVLKERQRHHNIRKRDILYIIFLAFGGAVIMWFKTQDLGVLSVIISILTALIIVLLTSLVFFDKK